MKLRIYTSNLSRIEGLKIFLNQQKGHKRDQNS